MSQPIPAPTLLDVLSKINLQTFERSKGRLGGKTYEITKVSEEVAPCNYQTIGSWTHVINDNVATLERLMDRDDLPTVDVQTSVPVDGIMYTVHVQVTAAQAKVGRNGQAKD